MSTEFSVEFRGKYLQVQMAPGFELTVETAVQVWSAVISACKDNGCTLVLLEGTNVKRKMTTMDAYKSGTTLANAGLPLKVAFSVTEHKTDELTSFFTHVSDNRGVRVRFLPSRDAALAWLGVGETT